MNLMRRMALLVMTLVWLAPAGHAAAPAPGDVLGTWYKVVLELVRHTPTYSPPVASRAFAYLGITAFEVAASGSSKLQSLAGQVNGLTAVSPREAGATYDEAVVLNAALNTAVENFFGNTGPTGQHVMEYATKKMKADVEAGVASDVVQRSTAYGIAVADHILAWSMDDGGAVIENLGFPYSYKLTPGPAHWVPTSTIALQQVPLLPAWGQNRTFAMPDGASCPLPPPPTYSEDPKSEFYLQAMETYLAVKNLTAEQRAIARFWSDDPMLSVTPPGHWISIARQAFERHNTDYEKQVEVLARLGIAVADGFIGCWNAKFEYDLVRPVTYIRRVIDKKWEPLLITPPFPEYPSGHSSQSGAAAEVLTAMFGDHDAFTDTTDEGDALKPRPFTGFWNAAEEAGISRLYGGIHFRAAIERGLDQGRCIGGYANKLKMSR